MPTGPDKAASTPPPPPPPPAATPAPARESARPATARQSPPAPPALKSGMTGRLCPPDVNSLRDAFWCNVLRDMLNALVMLSQQQPELFDGRFAVLTKGGERIPIAEISPVFAVSMAGDESEREASLAVQCTVFRVQTPGGEVFTLPVQEIRALHTMTPALLDRLQREADREAPRGRPPRRPTPRPARNGDADDEDRPPFGFAAFTALPKLPPQPAPDNPME